MPATVKGTGRAGAAIRVAGTLAAFTWIATQVAWGPLVASLQDLAVASVVLAAVWMLVAQTLGALRWWCMLHAYGARVPRFGWMLRMYLVGFFYNTCVPGGVGGDVVRGLEAGAAFGTGATARARSVAVVFIERLCGMLGLLVLVLGATALWPIADLAALRSGAAIALGATAVGVAGTVALPGLVDRLPAQLAQPLRVAPPLVAPAWLGAGLLLSLSTHLFVALSGHAVVSGLAAGAPLTDALVIVPVSGVIAFLPISVGGAGVRETVFATLYIAVGLAETTAWAASVAVFALQIGLALVFGLLAPLGRSAPSP